ncbi:MAG: SMC-Scp complex subunit ScpB [Candidatus Zambryskibacteria bacterium]|nr:SMC-Scp complex subunit ScpB [Candidatus Zambryskibacteria bacterium]
MSNLETQIESVLLFKNEPVTFTELAKMLGISKDKIQEAVSKLQEQYSDRGIVIVSDGESISFGTSPENSDLIERIQKEELSRELGRAGLETLAIVLYRGPVSRREIDHIRGVNSGFILRSLLIRGLVERADVAGERSYSYKPTLKLLEHLGVTRREDLPEYGSVFKKVEEFVNNSVAEEAQTEVEPNTNVQ